MCLNKLRDLQKELDAGGMVVLNSHDLHELQAQYLEQADPGRVLNALKAEGIVEMLGQMPANGFDSERLRNNWINDYIDKLSLSALTSEDHLTDFRHKVLDEAISAVQSCELVSPNIKRIRLHEALGAILELKRRQG